MVKCSKAKYFGAVIKSTGVYEPTHWYHVLIDERDDGYICFTVNGFNSNFITKEELAAGYEIVLPSECFSNYEKFSSALETAFHRWGGSND